MNFKGTVMSNESVVIVAAKRTPMGGFNGNLSSLAATKLGEVAIKAACEEMDVSVIDEVIMGCVLPAGLGQSPARQASLGAGLPLSAGVTTINKVCGSGLKAVMMAHDLIKAGSATAVVAGGMESMSNAPYMLPKARENLQKFWSGAMGNAVKEPPPYFSDIFAARSNKREWR